MSFYSDAANRKPRSAKQVLTEMQATCHEYFPDYREGDQIEMMWYDDKWWPAKIKSILDTHHINVEGKMLEQGIEKKWAVAGRASQRVPAKGLN